tara:strand:+ start:8599 stop:9951 length:1353 start_codon:yes stop_codon:yes gene_type:complete
MPKTLPGPSAALILALAALPAGAGDARELAARLRSETAFNAEAMRAANVAPVPMSASLLIQTRYMYNVRKNPSPTGSRIDTVGFDLPRAQLRLDANIANEQLLAHVMFDFGNAEGDRGRGRGADSDPSGEGSPELREAWAQYNFSGEQTGYYLKAGQFRSLLLYEESIAPEFQLAVERSVTNEFFAPGNTQGVALGFVGPDIAWEVSFNDGIDSLGSRQTVNTAFDSPFEADFAVSSRVDWKLAGDWSRFEDFTSWRGEDVAARVGAGLHWERRGDTNPAAFIPDFIVGVGDALDFTNITWTVDASYEGDGWHAFVAYVGQRLEWEIDSPVVGTLILTQHGIVGQAGVFFIDDVEVFARYEGFLIDSALIEGFGAQEDYYHFLTLGLNYFLTPRSHAAKFSFDLTTALTDSDVLDAGTTSSVFFPDPTVTGLLGGSPEEWLMRAQFQFLF